MVGSALGYSSPVPIFSPTFLMDIELLEDGAAFAVPLDHGHEAAVYASYGPGHIRASSDPGALLKAGDCAVFRFLPLPCCLSRSTGQNLCPLAISPFVCSLFPDP